MNTLTQEKTEADTFIKRKTRAADSALAKLELQIAELDRRVEQALQEEGIQVASEPAPEPLAKTQPPVKPDDVMIWGVPFSYLTLAETLQHIDRLIAHRQAGYFITANLNYNMLTDQHPELKEVNDNASFIVCDGMPMVWFSRLLKRPLPERIAGSELIYALNHWAARKGHRVFFLGGAPGVAQAAADKLAERYPGLQVAGVESPPFRPLSEQENEELIARIRATNPDIVYVAFGQPKGELWMANNYQKIDAVCVQLGASFDFVAGGVARAPMWVQKIGMEWFYRLSQEPGRMIGRYCRNFLFLFKAVLRDLFHRQDRYRSWRKP